MSKNLKYFCPKCKSVKLPKVVSLTREDGTHYLTEVIKTFSSLIKKEGGKVGSETKEFKGRQIECGHFISIYTPAFSHSDNKLDDSLNETETEEIRREIEKSMLGKNGAEFEQQVLFWADQYQTLLKIANKQLKQAKYAIQFVDQLREKYSSLLENEDTKKNFEQKFAYFLDQRPTTNKAAEIRIKEVDKAANKQLAAKEKAVEVFAKGMGISIGEARKMMGLPEEIQSKKEIKKEVETPKPVSNVDAMKALLAGMGIPQK